MIYKNALHRREGIDMAFRGLRSLYVTGLEIRSALQTKKRRKLRRHINRLCREQMIEFNNPRRKTDPLQHFAELNKKNTDQVRPLFKSAFRW